MVIEKSVCFFLDILKCHCDVSIFFFFFFFFFLHFSRVVCNVKITSHNYVLHDVSPISVLMIFVDLNFQGNV